MSEVNFTPGPWFVSGPNRYDTYSIGIQSEIEPWCYHVCDVCDDIDPVEHNANAALISSAPDLYEALEQSVTSMQDSGYANSSVVVVAAKQALSKARGES